MKRKVFIIAILSFSLFLNLGCVTERKAIVMSMSEFMKDYNMTADNDTKYLYYYFDSLEDGDELIIKDTIYNLTYHYAQNYTDIRCVTEINSTFPIQGDITNKFESGDSIEIDVHIIKDVFPHPYDPTWTISIETIKEGWDTTLHQFILLPQEFIKKV